MEVGLPTRLRGTLGEILSALGLIPHLFLCSFLTSSGLSLGLSTFCLVCVSLTTILKFLGFRLNFVFQQDLEEHRAWKGETMCLVLLLAGVAVLEAVTAVVSLASASGWQLLLGTEISKM
jgi:hypothetical protein